MSMSDADRLLIGRIRQGDQAAWCECINRFEGRLLAFVNRRLRDRAASEDVVQETFIAFLNSLPNYREGSPLEAFLFAIASHKLTDVLRSLGRRPSVPFGSSNEDGGWEEDIAGSAPAASSLARSREDGVREARLLEQALKELIEDCVAAGDWRRVKCLELLFVLGWPNKAVAQTLRITEQTVANYKFAAVQRLTERIKRSGMTQLPLPLESLDESGSPARTEA